MTTPATFRRAGRRDELTEVVLWLRGRAAVEVTHDCGDESYRDDLAAADSLCRLLALRLQERMKELNPVVPAGSPPPQAGEGKREGWEELWTGLDGITLGDLWPGWRWHVRDCFDGNGDHIGALISMIRPETDVFTGEPRCHPTREWLVKYGDSLDQIMRTAFGLAHNTLDHHLREVFEYGGRQRPFNPHRRMLEESG